MHLHKNCFWLIIWLKKCGDVYSTLTYISANRQIKSTNSLTELTSYISFSRNQNAYVMNRIVEMQVAGSVKETSVQMLDNLNYKESYLLVSLGID
jgi:hypothetical protein